MRKMVKTALTAVIVSSLWAALASHPAEASLYDRMKDIYHAPDKVDELTRQYNESLRQMEEQQQQLREELEVKQQALELENEQLAEQNVRLARQNSELAGRLAQIEEKRAALTRKIVTSVLVVAAMLLGYVAAIRIWRYRVWRRQLREGGRTAGL